MTSGTAAKFLLTVAILAFFVTGPLAQDDLTPSETPRRADPKVPLHTALQDLLANTRAATFDLTSYQKMGEDEEFTVGRVTWAGHDRLRIDVDEGRGKGATAVLKEDRVIAWRRGWLSFIKFKFKLRNKRVMSMRGRDLSNTGYFDDLRFVLDHWDMVQVSFDETGYIIEYNNEQQLPTRLWLAFEPLHVYRHEVRDSGIEVERYTYENVLLNPSIDPGLLDP